MICISSCFSVGDFMKVNLVQYNQIMAFLCTVFIITSSNNRESIPLRVFTFLCGTMLGGGVIAQVIRLRREWQEERA